MRKQSAEQNGDCYFWKSSLYNLNIDRKPKLPTRTSSNFSKYFTQWKWCDVWLLHKLLGKHGSIKVTNFIPSSLLYVKHTRRFHKFPCVHFGVHHLCSKFIHVIGIRCSTILFAQCFINNCVITRTGMAFGM